MALYVRAVLADYVVNKVDHVTRIDLVCAIQRLRSVGSLTDRHVSCLRMHLYGYTPEELARVFLDWRTLLTESYALIAEESGLTDESFLRTSIAQYPKYRKIMPALLQRMEILGRDFNDMDT